MSYERTVPFDKLKVLLLNLIEPVELSRTGLYPKVAEV